MISFSVDKSEFLKHIYFCVGIVDNRSTMMVLSHIFVEAKDDKVFLSSTDLESSVYSSLPAKVDPPGSICISGKKLYDACISSKVIDDPSLYEISDHNPIIAEFDLSLVKQ